MLECVQIPAPPSTGVAKPPLAISMHKEGSMTFLKVVAKLRVFHHSRLIFTQIQTNKSIQKWVAKVVDNFTICVPASKCKLEANAPRSSFPFLRHHSGIALKRVKSQFHFFRRQNWENATKEMIAYSDLFFPFSSPRKISQGCNRKRIYNKIDLKMWKGMKP